MDAGTSKGVPNPGEICTINIRKGALLALLFIGEGVGGKPPTTINLLPSSRLRAP